MVATFVMELVLFTCFPGFHSMHAGMHSSTKMTVDTDKQNTVTMLQVLAKNKPELYPVLPNCTVNSQGVLVYGVCVLMYCDMCIV